MSKELEAFERVWEDCSRLDLDYVSKHNLMDDLREIKKVLTKSNEIAKSLIYMVDELNLSKCGENSKVRKKIREFKTLLEGEIK